MIVTGDYETYYDKDYSLSKMSTVEYLLDHRFEVLMLSLKLGDAPSEILVGHAAVAARLAQLDWDSIAWLSHHTAFDGAILAWHFGHTPKMWLDTLSMCRAATHWNIGRSSLKAVSDYLGLPPKGDEVVRAQGKHLVNFSHQELQDYAAYCIRDNENCREIFDIVRPCFEASELRLIDLVQRMFIQPQIRLNPHLLAEHLASVQADKAQILAGVANIDRSVFSSQQQFAQLLESKGVEVPKKISPTTGEEIPALAKGDRAFKELCEDTTQPLEVQTLLAARLSVKSTIEETRSEKLLQLSLKSWPDGRALLSPVPLKYSGARTHRLSGDDKYNWQNFQRGSRIREAIEAPPGFRVVHRDSSQIEARMTSWLAGCDHLTAAFAQGRDVYSEFASTVYGRPITKANIKERFVGKTSILGLGYGAGPTRFRNMLFIGNGGVSVTVSEEEAENIVHAYRRRYPEIRDLWRAGDQLLAHMLMFSGRLPKGPGTILWVSPFDNVVQVGYEGLWLPNGLCIVYPGLESGWNYLTERVETTYYTPNGGGRVKIYGAKVIENISQGLSRIILTDIAVRVFEETDYHPALSTHDSLDYIVPEAEASVWDAYLEQEFAKVPPWALGLPLASEGGWGRNLAEAERRVNQ